MPPLSPAGAYVLLVEDEPGDAGLTRAMVAEGWDSGHAPALQWVQSVAAAQRQLAGEPDCLVVLLDLGLPDSQGLAGLQALLPLAPDFPIIVLTGDGGGGANDLGIRAVEAGAQDFLIKGHFDATALRRSVEYASRRKRAERRELDRERQTALDAAVTARDELQAVLGRIHDGFVALDLQWRYTYANQQAARMMRHEHPRDIVGRLLWDEYPMLVDSPVGTALRDSMALQQPAVMEVHYQPWNAWYEIRMHPSPQGMTLYFSDITQRRASAQAVLDFQFELSQLAQRLLDQERTMTRRVAQALHDHLGQTLAVARLNLEACLGAHREAMPAELRDQGGRIARLLDQAVREVRQVLADLRPPLLEEQGLAVALDNEIQALDGGGAGPDVLLEADEGVAGTRWPPDVEYAAFMVAREALSNALRHARASLVRVILGGSAQALHLEVVDDGGGIAEPLLRGRPGHLGIVGMRERCIAIGARFTLSRDTEVGTRVGLDWDATGVS